MKKLHNPSYLLILLLVFLLFMSVKTSYSGSFHFGVISAVKDKVEEIKEEKEKNEIIDLTIITPAKNSVLAGTVSVIVEAVNVVKIEFYVDGVLKATDTSTPYIYTFDTTQYTNGTHAIDTKGYGKSEQTTTIQRTVYVNNDNIPAISIISPAGNPTLSGVVEITANASDDKGVAKVDFYIDETLKFTDTISPYSFTLDTALYANGSHMMKVEVSDTINQTASVQQTIVIDNNSVSLSVTSPKNGAIIKGDVNITTDAVSAVKVEFYIDGVLKSTASAPPYTFTWETTKRDNGGHIIRVQAYSMDNETVVGRQLSIVVDNPDLPPTITFKSPAEGATVSSYVSISADVSDDDEVSKIELYVDDVLKDTDTYIWDETYYYFWNTTTYTNGAHIIKIKAYDNANQTTTAQRSFTVDNDNPPTISITTPTDLATVSGTVEVTVDAKDDKGISKVEFSIDDVLKSTDTTSPYTYSWDTTLFNESMHILTVKIYDTKDQTATDEHIVSIDNGNGIKTEIVDSVGDVGQYASLTLDSNNNPHIAYYDKTNTALKYAKWTGTAWSIETIDSTGDVGQYASLTLDSSKNPHIAYYDYTNYDLKYAKWTGAAWNIETVDSTGDVGQYASLTLDSNNNPHIAYYDKTNTALKYAKWTGSSWSVETVDLTGEVGKYASLTLDSNDRPHICYVDSSNYNTVLKYAKWSGTEWNKEIIAFAGYGGGYPSLILDSSDKPHVAYYDYGGSDLKYAQKTGAEWSIETIDSAGDVGLYSSLALDSNGKPQIAYYDYYLNYNLKYAQWTGTAWNIEVLDAEGNVGLYPSLAIDSDNKLHVAYYDYYSNYDLKYTTRK